MNHSLIEQLRAAGCIYAEDEARVLEASATGADQLAAMAAARCAGRPLEYVVGWAQFGGRRVSLDDGVFIPRRRSEYLLKQAASLARPGGVVVDVGCGSGALALALSDRVGDLELYACDIDPVAVRCARRNLAGRAQVYESDLLAGLPTDLPGRVSLMIANLPYVPTTAMAVLPAEARLYEPPGTLDGGVDGLDVHRRLAAAAHDWLAPDGYLLIEVSDTQVGPARRLFKDAGFRTRIRTSRRLETNVVMVYSAPT